MPTIIAGKPLVSGTAVEKHAIHNADIPLRHVPPDSFLLLGDDPLLDGQVALHQFCEPVRVVALHRGRRLDEAGFIGAGGLVIHAAGHDVRTDREISVELVGRHGGRVLVRYPDDRHLVGGVNLPGEPISSAQPGDEPGLGRLVWSDGWRIEYG